MTAIAYSSTAGGPVKGVLPLEHLSTSRPCAEPLSKILGPRTMLEPSQCPHREALGVKCKKWTERGGGETEAEGDRVRSWKVTWDRGVRRAARRLKDEGCRARNISVVEGSWRKCVESRRVVTARLTAIETEGATKRKEQIRGNKWKKRPFCLNSISVGEAKTRRKMDQQRLRVFLWLTILLFSLCPEMASSQVRM